MTDEPLIIAFCCHYCAYAAADLAGSMRLQYPANVRVLRLPCTGKIEVNYLLAAFERGADGVIVAGCLEGGCHYLEGNLRARRRVERARQLLAEIGLQPERLEMRNLSSAEGPRFAEIVTTMVERLRQLGPSPLRHDPAQKPLDGIQGFSTQEIGSPPADPALQGACAGRACSGDKR
jgi:coenzyme F420-reducing hydrogenase delta subunit